MKFLCSSIPALGHFHPMLPIVNALAANGHEILFAAPRGFHPKVIAAGFEARVAGMDMDALIAAADEPSAAGELLRKDQKAALMFTQIAPNAMYEPLLEIAKDWKPDILLHEEGEYAAPLVSYLLGLPNIAVGWPSPMRAAFQLERVEKSIAKLWTDAGVTPVSNAGVFRTLFLDTCPPTLQTEFGMSITTRQPIRPCILKESEHLSSPDWLSHMPDAPIVHVTFGTVATYNNAASIYTDIIEGLRDEQVNLVLTIGESIDPYEFVAQKRNVHIERYIEHEKLLPHCDVVICHGGCGTTISALSHGLPLMIIPQGGAVQLRNAQACERAGAGMMLATENISVLAIRTKVLQLLNEARFKQTAQKIAHEIHRQPLPSDVVSVIEKLVIKRFQKQCESGEDV